MLVNNFSPSSEKLWFKPNGGGYLQYLLWILWRLLPPLLRLDRGLTSCQSCETHPLNLFMDTNDDPEAIVTCPSLYNSFLMLSIDLQKFFIGYLFTPLFNYPSKNPGTYHWYGDVFNSKVFLQLPIPFKKKNYWHPQVLSNRYQANCKLDYDLF